MKIKQFNILDYIVYDDDWEKPDFYQKNIYIYPFNNIIKTGKYVKIKNSNEFIWVEIKLNLGNNILGRIDQDLTNDIYGFNDYVIFTQKDIWQ